MTFMEAFRPFAYLVVKDVFYQQCLIAIAFKHSLSP